MNADTSKTEIHSSTRIRPALLVGLILPCLLATATATFAALDGKTYPGTICNAGSGATTNSTTGILYNNSTTAKTWSCPVVRDKMAAKENGITKVRIAVIDDNDEDRVRCDLKSRAFTGAAIDSAVKQSGVNPKSATTIVLDNFGEIKSANRGYYILRCRIPGKQGGDKSGIRSYYIEEG